MLMSTDFQAYLGDQAGGHLVHIYHMFTVTPMSLLDLTRTHCYRCNLKPRVSSFTRRANVFVTIAKTMNTSSDFNSRMNFQRVNTRRITQMKASSVKAMTIAITSARLFSLPKLANCSVAILSIALDSFLICIGVLVPTGIP